LKVKITAQLKIFGDGKKAVQNGYKVQTDIRNCPTEGICDNFAVRNQFGSSLTNIQLIVNVLCLGTEQSPNCPITQTTVNDQINQVNMDYANTGFYFTINQTRFIVDTQYGEIDAYSPFGSNWYIQIQALKVRHAVFPHLFLNTYITRARAGSFGTLLGIGTFPWDPVSDRAEGGLWMNSAYVGQGRKTFAHEIGHCIGLWHTFHGDSEVPCTSGCYEEVHQDFGNDTFSNTVGDFCADTPSQPLNYNCVNPTNRDCKGNLYTAIPVSQLPFLLNNVMAYTPDTCMQGFTPSQAARAHCWTCDRLANWIPNQCQI